jgi:transposase-like protein
MGDRIIGKRWSPKFKRLVLDLAEGLGSDAKSYREFNVSKSTFYKWRKMFREKEVSGLIPRKPIAKSHPRQLSADTVEKIIELRKTYHLCPDRITWYLKRYHGIHTSCPTVFRTLGRLGLKKLPRGADRRAIHARRYAKVVPGHNVQVDVRFGWSGMRTTVGKLPLALKR